jgi:hypothetical protein
MTRIPSDPYMIPDLARRIRNGGLTPLDGVEVCISGRRYHSPMPRGFMPNWKPQKGGRQIMIDRIQEILEEYKDYLPLTGRQIYYRILGKYGLEKGEDLSANVLKVLNFARRSERVPFSAIRDDGFTDEDAPGWDSKESLIKALEHLAENFELKGNTAQPHYVELWCEAAGMVPQLVRVAHDYGVPVRSCGGFDSLSVKHDFVQQVLGREQPTMVLQCGDLDPSGVSILDSFASDISQFVADYKERAHPFYISRSSISGEPAIEFKRVLVRPEHETMHDLIREAKPESPKTPGVGVCPETHKRYNPPFDYTIRAEAFAPDVLAEVVRAAIEDVIDLAILAKTRKRSVRIRKELIEQFAEWR